LPIDPLRGNEQPIIRGNRLIERVVFDGSRARGVVAVFRGRRQLIKADTVVLCAGVYGSPEILLHSGIGAPDELAPLGSAPSSELPPSATTCMITRRRRSSSR
jgi:choline dehydrogenase-like flavoprotein